MTDNNRDFDSCPYADAFNSNRWKNHPEIFNDLASQMMPIVRHPLAESQNYTSEQEQNMTYKNAYSITDKLKCEIYEGVFKQKPYFTPEVWSNCRSLSKWVLIEPYTDAVRSITCTKQMYYPMKMLQDKVDAIL